MASTTRRSGNASNATGDCLRTDPILSVLSLWSQAWLDRLRGHTHPLLVHAMLDNGQEVATVLHCTGDALASNDAWKEAGEGSAILSFSPGGGAEIERAMTGAVEGTVRGCMRRSDHSPSCLTCSCFGCLPQQVLAGTTVTLQTPQERTYHILFADEGPVDTTGCAHCGREMLITLFTNLWCPNCNAYRLVRAGATDQAVTCNGCGTVHPKEGAGMLFYHTYGPNPCSQGSRWFTDTGLTVSVNSAGATLVPRATVATVANGRAPLQYTGTSIIFKASQPMTLWARSVLEQARGKVRLSGQQLILGNETAARLIFDLEARVVREPAEALPTLVSSLTGINSWSVSGYGSLAQGSGDSPAAFNTRLLGPAGERRITGFFVYELALGRSASVKGSDRMYGGYGIV